MSLGILVRSLVKESSVRWNYGLNLWGRLGSRSFSVAHSVAQKADSTAQKNFESMKNKFDFEQFKQTQVKSFEKFKESPSIKKICGNDLEKILRAYEEYCVCKFNRYVQSEYGGNPATMV